LQRTCKAADALDTRRYETAAAAATSQQLQQAGQDRQELVAIIKTSLLIRLDKEGDAVKKDDTVVAVTSGIDLTKYKDRIRGWVAGQPARTEVASQTAIKF
jgi:hypothetical protein